MNPYSIMPETIRVDCRGENCPRPLIETRKAINKAKAGDTIIFCPPYYRLPFEYYYAGDPEIPEVPCETVASGDSAALYKRIWLIQGTGEGAAATAAEEALIDRYGSDTMVLREEFPHVTVELFRSADNPPGDSQDAS